MSVQIEASGADGGISHQNLDRCNRYSAFWTWYIDHGEDEAKATMEQVLSNAKLLYKLTLTMAFRISRTQSQTQGYTH